MVTRLQNFNRDAGGYIMATSMPVEDSDRFVGGLRFRVPDGSVRITGDTPTTTVNAFPVLQATGALSVNTGPATRIQSGIPLTSTGHLAVATAGEITHTQNGLPFIGEQLAVVDMP